MPLSYQTVAYRWNRAHPRLEIEQSLEPSVGDAPPTSTIPSAPEEQTLPVTDPDAPATKTIDSVPIEEKVLFSTAGLESSNAWMPLSTAEI